MSMTTPTISVVIPTRDRPTRLRECLDALSRQDYPRGSWEVVVVDDGTPAPERVADALAPFRSRHDIQLIAQQHAGPASARNAGAARARFDYLAFTDDDCLPHPYWLSELATAFVRTPDAVLGGRVLNGLASNLCSEASHQLVSYVVDYFLNKSAPFFPSNNLALSRATFDAIGGFDVRFPLAAGEDRDLCAKCRRIGARLIPAPDALVEHRHPLDFAGFLRQHFNYGRGAFVCRRLSAARDAGDSRIEPLRFYIDLIRQPFRGAPPSRGRLRIAALLLASQVANAAGFFGERFDRNLSTLR
jgi:glycosyltransferase involved in cell wall biosynthesis